MATKFHVEDRLNGLDDPVRAYNWEVNIVPTSLGTMVDVFKGDSLTVRCKSISIPDRSLGIIESHFFGMTQRFPGRVQFGGTIDMVIEETEDLLVSTELFQWENKLFNITAGGTNAGASQASKKRQLCADIEIKLFKVNGEELKKKVLIRNCWPSQSGAVQLDYSSNDSVKLNVTFAYDYWEWVDNTGASTKDTK